MTSAGEIPKHCPGAESELAGRASACSGCPNQALCSTTEKNLAEDLEVLNSVSQRLEDVKKKVLVLSGKGGVGKSTVTCMLGRSLARRNKTVSILDIDICGPSTPHVLGVQGEQVHQSGSGWSPVYVDDNLSVMSVGFLLKSLDDAIIWRGPKKSELIKQFLSEVDWGHLDYLLIDTPPGTSDEHISITHLLSTCKATCALIVSSPQEISLLDVRKEINFCKRIGLPIIGVVENMSWFVCPKCSTSSTIFPNTTGGVKAMANEMGVPFLGQIPLDLALTQACDEGRDLHESTPLSASAMAFNDLTESLITALADA